MFENLISKKTYKNVTLNPFRYIKPSIGATYAGFLIVLLPQLIMLFYTKSIMALWVIFMSVIASVAADVIYAILEKNYSFEVFSSLLLGLIIGMLFPSTYPLYGVFFITLFMLIFVKYTFGGFYSSWINPAAFVIAVAYIINMSAFPQYLVNATDLQSRNTALTLINNGTIPLLENDPAITAFLNKTIFKFFSLSIPDGYVTLFWDCHSIIPAFRFNLITLVSSIILISLDMIDVIIPFVFIAVYSLLVRILGPVVVQGIPFQGDILLALLTSGTLFSTLFILQWNGTTPITNWGKVLYGIISAMVAFLIMGCGTSPAGYVFMILIMNVISPVIETFESKQVKHKIEKILIPHIKSLNEAKNV